MAQQIDRHNITNDLYLLKTTDSKKWIARLKVGNEWLQKSTKTEDKNEAIHKAFTIKAEYEAKANNGIPYKTTQLKRGVFKSIAELAIQRMERDIDNGIKVRTYKDYIKVLNKYHIPFFKTMYIQSIDRNALQSFDEWRAKQFGKPPARSTINTHNAAFNRVFDEAVIQNIITQSQVPALSNNGTSGNRRASFTREEWNQVLHSDISIQFWQRGKKQRTRDIRTLLYDYIVVAINTGIRPGTELDNLEWQDIHTKNINGKTFTTITVRKGKTTEHTGTREVICKPEGAIALQRIKERNKNTKPLDKIFQLPDGSTTPELGRVFGQLLEQLQLKDSPHGTRTLYSIRHSYITWAILDGMKLPIIANQCGTSVEMIEKHYNHIVPLNNAELLSASHTDELIEAYANSSDTDVESDIAKLYANK